jgi:2-oxoglutarate ferredoxin oxidoreductase subunit alpha
MSVQETFDQVQLCFYLAEKYRTPTLLLSDAIIGQMKEDVEIRTLDFGPPEEDKSWALKIHRSPKGKSVNVHSAIGIANVYNEWLEGIRQKNEKIVRDEVRYQAHMIDDAEVVLIAFGSSARSALGACAMARKEGLKVGVFRPITLWPFPEVQLGEIAEKVKNVLVIEDNLGQMVEDVKAAVGERTEVHFMGILSRHMPDSNGMILPSAIYREAKKLL